MGVAASVPASTAARSTGDDGGGGGTLSSHKKQKAVSIKESTSAVTETEIEEQKDVPMKESTTKPESSSSKAAVEDEELYESDSDGETKPRIFQNLPRNFPSRFTKLIEHPESIHPQILLEKKLRDANVDAERNRMPISGKEMEVVFLLPKEEEKLNSGKAMKVPVIEPSGETVSTLVLRLRSRRPTYVLTGDWKDVVARNSDVLKRRGLVRVWYFRVNGRLWFAIEGVEEGEKDCELARQMDEKWHGPNVLGP